MKGGTYMPYQYNKLRGKIIEHYGTQGNFANALGLSVNSVSKKLNCRTGFTQEEMNKWAELLDIELKDYPAYFFT
jgi:hypothetical protein